MNDHSTPFRVVHGRCRAPRMGVVDGTTSRCYLPRPCRFIRQSHRGSLHGDTEAGVMRLGPNAVVISAGLGNSYGHPDLAERWASTARKARLCIAPTYRGRFYRSPDVRGLQRARGARRGSTATTRAGPQPSDSGTSDSDSADTQPRSLSKPGVAWVVAERGVCDQHIALLSPAGESYLSMVVGAFKDQ